jgi:hypothetical protein
VVELDQARSIIYVVQATSTEFGLHAGYMKVTTRHEAWLSIRLNICLIYPMYFLYIYYNKNMLIVVKNNKECSSQIRLVCHKFKTFVQNEVLMEYSYPWIKTSQFQIASSFYRGCSIAIIKRPPVFSNVSTGNITVCRVQHRLIRNALRHIHTYTVN